MITYKNITLNDDKKECFVDKNQIELSKNEYLLLKFFIENQNKIFSRRELLNNVWNSNVSLRAVDTAVSKLRKKLGMSGNFIKTRLGFGYGIINN